LTTSSRATVLATIASLGLATGSLAQSRPHELMVGDEAPAPVFEEWFRGEPVESLQSGTAYVVEFWATWCAPCIAGFPHLSDLQDEHADDGIVIIGVGSKAAPDSKAKGRKLIKDQGDKIRYRVAWDDGATTWNRYMNASGSNGLPTAFVVDRSGRIAYIGHPTGMEAVLESIAAGEFDIDEAASAYRLQLEATEIQRRFNLLMTQRKGDEAYEAGSKLVDHPGAQRLNVMAGVSWMIVDPGGMVEQKDLELALAAAKKAVTMTDWRDPAQMDTLAWAHHLRGETERAIEIQERALALVPDDAPETREALEASLRTFRGARSQD